MSNKIRIIGIVLIFLWGLVGWEAAVYDRQQVGELQENLKVVQAEKFTAVHTILQIMRENCSTTPQSNQEDRLILPFNDTPLDDDGSHRSTTL